MVTVRARPAGSNLRKRAPVLALGAAIALLIGGLLLAAVNERAYKAQKIDEVTVEAGIVGLLVSAALEFQDRRAAQEYVEALKADPEIDAAAIYDASGALFASYSRHGAPDVPATAPPAGTSFQGGRLIVAAPVTHGEATLGTVYLDMLTETLAQWVQRHVGIGLLVTMAALLMAMLGLAQAALAKANAELEKRAVDLATANRELRAQIAEREKAEEALRQSHKMEAIGRLTGGVAHDFNNLLTVVAGNLDLIDRIAETGPDGGVPRDRLRRLVDAAQRGLARGERLTRQLLILSRQEPLESRIVDVNAAIAEFAPLLQRAIGEAIDLRLRLGAGKWLCKLDPAQFEAAMLNLAINARDATGGSGALTIATALAPGGGRGDIVLTVSDTGSGMPPEVLLRIFEPFYTTKPVGKGSGLGLAQVWAFVNQSGGRIEVDSGPGEGTTFRLNLPLSSEIPDDLAAEGGAPAERGGTERILVVEDEDDVREVAAATLQRLGYRTVVGRDGRDALAILDRDDDFDLLFTDYVMPNGINGAELAREACRLLPRLKVLLTSGYAGQAAPGADASRLDGFPLIAKPYRSADLAARIREILDPMPAERVPAVPPG